MANKRAPPPEGADVLYSNFDATWDAKHGVTRVTAHSGSFSQSATLTLRATMELHHQLGRIIETALHRGEITPLSAPPQN